MFSHCVWIGLSSWQNVVRRSPEAVASTVAGVYMSVCQLVFSIIELHLCKIQSQNFKGVYLRSKWRPGLMWGGTDGLKYQHVDRGKKKFRGHMRFKTDWNQRPSCQGITPAAIPTSFLTTPVFELYLHFDLSCIPLIYCVTVSCTVAMPMCWRNLPADIQTEITSSTQNCWQTCSHGKNCVFMASTSTSELWLDNAWVKHLLELGIKSSLPC